MRARKVGLGLMQAAGVVWAALEFREVVLAVLRSHELFAREESIRNQYADVVAAVVVTLDTEGIVRHMNRYGLELLGVTEEEVAGQDVFELWGTPEARGYARAEFERFCRSGGLLGATLEFPVFTSRGTRILRVCRSAVLNEAGEVVEVISHGEDVTEQRKVEEALRFESFLLDSVYDSIIVMRRDGEILYVNAAAHEMRGYSKEEFLALEPWAWIAPESREHALEQHHKTAEGGTALYEVTTLCKDGRRLLMEVRSQLVVFEGELAIMKISRDISARRQAEELISQMAFEDPLTGLPNRRLVFERLTSALAQLDGGAAGRLAVIYVDIDNLKAVNDTLGHEAGDHLIKITGDKLGWVTRDGDTLGRVGGDEFVLVVPDLSVPEHAEDIAGRLLEFTSEILEIEGFTVRPSASIGICHCANGMSASEALKRADRAMYVAKKTGGNRFAVYEPSMEAAISERFRLKSELVDAIDKGELEVHYQAIIETSDHRVAGVEALLRWQHPTRGLLVPQDFMDIAEESGLIVPIGRWVLFETCKRLTRWRQAGIEVPRMAVNLSTVQLLDGDLVRDVSEALAHAGLQPPDLELEITETSVMERIDVIVPVLEQLRAMGISLALDDFGTGHSSLERLQELPISTLKIDSSFVSDLCSESDSHPIIDTILVLASRLHLRTVAEGVECPCHLDYLRRAGCDEVQGYLFSRPCDVSVIEAAMVSGGMTLHPGSCRSCHRVGSCKLRRLSPEPGPFDLVV